MSRIKKRGLDYFPMNTDFIHDRLVRRIMKREGDVSLAVLLQTFCAIYAGEGYYVSADSLFYDDLADCLYQQEAADVERILTLAVDYGLFDATLFRERHILTSADIQRQFLFITKRRTTSLIEPAYSLLPPEELAGAQPASRSAGCKTETTASEARTASPSAAVPGLPCADAAETARNVTGMHISETFSGEKDENQAPGTQSIEKQSTEKQNKEYLLLHSSPETGETADAGRKPAEDAAVREESSSSSLSRTNPNTPRREWTDEDINRLQPPADGQNRNLEGLIYNLRQFRIPPQEQYAIVLKSNFGVIGHPMWKGFFALRESHGKIRQPGRYLLSLCR